MTDATHAPPDTGADSAALDRAAFARTADARSALRAEDALPYTLDALHAVSRAMWIAPRLMPFRADLLALSGFDVTHLDNLETHARALRFVHAEILRRVERTNELPGLRAEAYKVRALMMAYAELLSLKGTVAPAFVAKLREGSGNRDLIEDLTVLVQELQALPAPMLSADTPVTRAEVTRAADLANELNVRIGNTPEGNLSQAELLDERRKLGSLLVKAHAQLRRGMAYLRFEQGDAAELVPSLYVGSGKRKAPAPDPDEGLATLHEELHSAPLDPEDDPFAPDA